jgi:signal-transduction protein with cAMP-binding, CBS, and nucleotidyltransferase domain
MAKRTDPSSSLKLAEKIPIFRGLSANQVQQVLHAGKMESFEKGKLLCKEGENSISMFILLSGELVAKSKGVVLAHLKPVEILGEMG